MAVVDYDALDPGIRDVVRMLNDAGFTTTDSGDGVSKPAEQYHSGEATPCPHVAASTTAARLFADADRMAALLGAGWVVQASYSTLDRSVVLLATHNMHEWQPPPPALCTSCVHLRPFELVGDLFTCPVVNIRIHATMAAEFGCNQHERASHADRVDLAEGAVSVSDLRSGRAEHLDDPTWPTDVGRS